MGKGNIICYYRNIDDTKWLAPDRAAGLRSGGALMKNGSEGKKPLDAAPDNMKKGTVRFRLLGTFGYEQGDKAQSVVIKGNKLRSFLQYLIVNHAGCITYDELIEQFWPDGKSDNPGSALRYSASKARESLSKLFPGYKNLLVTVSHGFVWSTDVEIVLDSEQFEAVYMHAKRLKDDARADALLNAADMYHGDFLPGNDDSWAQSLRVYYRTLYLDACKETLPLLEEKERWPDIVRLCETAYRVDFSVEEFTLCLMEAYIAQGHPQKAIDHYEMFRAALMLEYELEPSASVTQIYARAMSAKNGSEGQGDLLSLVAAHPEEEKAYKCSFGTFQGIVALELRHLKRTKQESSIVKVKIARSQALSTDVSRLERVLLEGLRTGDTVSRFDQSSYIVLLPGAGSEQAQNVIERLKTKFTRLYSHSRALISYQVCPLTAESEEGTGNTL